MNSVDSCVHSSLKKTSKIKICGLKRTEDIIYANKILPDYIGFVFAPSPRQVSIERAQELKSRLDPTIHTVGVFVNEKIDMIVPLCKSGTIDMVQLHGDEDSLYVENLRKYIPHPIIKAIRVQSDIDIKKADMLPCDYLLLDSYKAGSYGGNGTTFNWSLASQLSKPFFLAGGIHANNVLSAVKQCKPFSIDVSSGVETNGRKDYDKILKIVQLIHSIC